MTIVLKFLKKRMERIFIDHILDDHFDMINSVKDNPIRFLMVYSCLSAFVEDKGMKDEFVTYLDEKTNGIKLENIIFTK